MPAFTTELRGDDLILRNKYGVYSKKELETQLRDGHLTIEEIGSIYGLKDYQMVHVFNCLGIVYRNLVNDTRIYDPTISSSMHQVLLGTLLGDGYMKDPKSYALGHGVFQMDYCYHVAERLHPFVASIGDINTKSKTEKAFSFWTHHHDVFLPYFQRFYSHGKSKKYITSETVPDLGPEGLAYWFMDDGKHGYYLCVGKISEQEGSILIDVLKQNFGIGVTFQAQDKLRGHFNLYVLAKSRDKFLRLISPYIIPSMQYKLTARAPAQVVFSRSAVVSRHLELCKKAGRCVRYFGDKIIQKEVIEKGSIQDSKTKYVAGIMSAIQAGSQVSHTSIRKMPADSELRKLFDKGMTDSQIAKSIGVGRNRVSQLRRSLKIDIKDRRVTPEQDARLRELFLRPGVTLIEVMRAMHMSFYKVKKWAEAYHSALQEPLKIDGELDFYASGGSIAVCHDVSKGCDIYFSNVDAIYSELAWRDGYDKFMHRADIKGSTYASYLDGVLKVIRKLKIPTYIVLGKHAVPILKPPQVVDVKLRGYPCLLGIWYGKDPGSLDTNKDVLEFIGRTYERVLDFSAGYGNVAKVMLSHGKKFVCSDINRKCVYYIAKNFMGYHG